jgi:hypothetical protein
MSLSSLTRVHGVDFSGARLAGLTAWRAVLDIVPSKPRLVSVDSLALLAGAPEREVVFPWLVADILKTSRLAVGIDAPFTMPTPMSPAGTYREEIEWVGTFADAPTMGRTLANEALERFGVRHVRRETDRRSRTPFDSYHYRIVHQTFHVIRDVCGELARDSKTSILPFDYANLCAAERVVVETCPSSTLKRLELPFRGYKQPGKRPITRERRAVRTTILDALRERMTVPEPLAKKALADPGGDALDSILAALGTFESLRATDHEALSADLRLCREGWVYA